MFLATSIQKKLSDSHQDALLLTGDVLSRLLEDNLITPLDRYTGLMLCGHARKYPLLICALATMLSHYRGEGHSCLELDSLADSSLWLRISESLGMDGGWDDLTDSELVGTIADDLPLLLDGSRLYFQKVLRAEEALVAKISEMIAKSTKRDPKVHEISLDGITLDAVQEQAVATALASPICLVSGGPGTGKTTVAAAILSVFLAEKTVGDNARIGLAAPTGKAAARLQDAVNQLLGNAGAGGPEVIKAGTVHRLLGWSPGRRAFRFNAGNPLQLDLLIVDEVSMIDLELMRALLDAVPIGCHLVLLGDREQLASVAPGNVMADLCAGSGRKSVQPSKKNGAIGLTGEHIVLLRHNYRFASDSGIQRLARAVSEGDFSSVLDVLSSGREDVLWVQHQEGASLDLKMADYLPDQFLTALVDEEPATALASVGLFRVLTGVRHGPFGSVNLNRLIEKQLQLIEVLGSGPGFHSNQLLMATGNDYALRLFNGDTGIIRRDESGQLAAVFEGSDGEPRWLACDRLRSVETAFATTIHKSQGSEFDQVLVVLPEQSSPVLSRELLYTALTRARTRVTLVASLAALEQAVQRKTLRFSGLADRLWA